MDSPRTRKMCAADDSSEGKSSSVQKFHLDIGGCGDAHSKKNNV